MSSPPKKTIVFILEAEKKACQQGTTWLSPQQVGAGPKVQQWKKDPLSDLEIQIWTGSIAGFEGFSEPLIMARQLLDSCANFGFDDSQVCWCLQVRQEPQTLRVHPAFAFRRQRDKQIDVHQLSAILEIGTSGFTGWG